jgi:hypothetical protein
MQLLFDSNYHVLGGGLWTVIVLIAGIAAIFFYQAFKGAKSGSEQQVDSGTPNVHVEQNSENIPVYKLPSFLVGRCCCSHRHCRLPVNGSG